MNAAPVPRPISVHMFGLRLTTDSQPREKKGQPAHSTIGNDSTNSTQLCVAMSIRCSRSPSIASASTTSVSGKVHQKRREKSRNSGLSSSRSGSRGSSVIPHLGQVPG